MQGKIGKYNTNIHKAVIIPDDVFQTNKILFVTVHQNIACKLNSATHLWLSFIDQPQSDFVVFK